MSRVDFQLEKGLTLALACRPYAFGAYPTWTNVVTDGSGSVFALLREGSFLWNDYYTYTLGAFGPGSFGMHQLGPSTYYGRATMSSGDDGRVFALWSEQGGFIKLQAFRSAGSEWPPVTVTTNPTFSIRLGKDGNGNAVVGWQEFVGGTWEDSTHIQSFDRNGQPRWAPGGAKLPHSAIALLADGDGGMYVVLRVYVSSTEPYQLRVTRLDSEGGLQDGWPLDGLTVFGDVCREVLAWGFLEDGRGGVLVHRTCPRTPVYQVQRIGPAGDRRWGPNGVFPAIWGSLEPRAPRVCADGSGGAYVVWSRDPQLGTGQDLYVGHILPNGAMTEIGGERFISAPGDQVVSSVLADTTDGIYIGWLDTRNSTNQAYVGHFVADAVTPVRFSLVRAEARRGGIEVVWYVGESTFSGVVWKLGPEDGWQAQAEVTADGTRHVTFHDANVIPGRQYCYRLVDDRNPESASEDACVNATAGVGTSFSLGPTPTRGLVVLSFAAESRDPVEVRVFDVSGRLIGRESFTPTTAGPQQWPLSLPSGLHAGIYVVRLWQGSRIHEARAVLVR